MRDDDLGNIHIGKFNLGKILGHHRLMFTDFWNVMPRHLEGRFPHFRGIAFSILTVGEESTDIWYRGQELEPQTNQ